MAETSAIDAMLVLFRALTTDEQEEAFQQISDARLRQIAGEESEMARMIASLQRVARHVGTELTPDLYRAGYRELRDNGVEVIEVTS
jgi:DNA-binding transcriptional regulator YhcF (GntR family)